jgi:hypothetical protein
VARAAPPMAHLDVFIVSFICFVRGAMLNRAHTRKNTLADCRILRRCWRRVAFFTRSRNCAGFTG